MSMTETDRDPTFELLREDLAKNEADLAGQRASSCGQSARVEQYASPDGQAG